MSDLKPFVRNLRYYIFKVDDVNKALSDNQQMSLGGIIETIRNYRKKNNKNPDKKYVVVSEDWPMYEETWSAIKEYTETGKYTRPAIKYRLLDAIDQLPRYVQEPEVDDGIGFIVVPKLAVIEAINSILDE